jgi:hypothetical protein
MQVSWRVSISSPRLLLIRRFSSGLCGEAVIVVLLVEGGPVGRGPVSPAPTGEVHTSIQSMMSNN